MENLLFYSLLIFATMLLILICVLFFKINTLKKLFKASDKMNDNLMRERQLLNVLIFELKDQLNKKEEQHNCISDTNKCINKRK